MTMPTVPDIAAELARPVLFQAFDGFKRRRQMTVSAIPHPRGIDGAWECAGPPRRPVAIPIDWITLLDPVLTDTEEITLERLRAAASETLQHPWLAASKGAVAIATRIHRGMCKRCQRQAAETSALVTIAWAGRTLSREYYL